MNGTQVNIWITMQVIPKQLQERLAGLPRMKRCEREGIECSGRITWEHVFGRKYQKEWNIIALCWYHHLGKGLNKELNRHIAYQYATDEDLRKYKNYKQMKQEKKYLAQKYVADRSK